MEKAATHFREDCVDILMQTAHAHELAGVRIAEMDGLPRKSNNAVTIEEVIDWQKMRANGTPFNQIGKSAGRSRSLIALYLDPQRAPTGFAANSMTAF